MNDKVMALTLRSIVQFLNGNVVLGRELAKRASEADYLNPICDFKVSDMIPSHTVEQLYLMVS